ncbi:MAG: hypothetical protein ACP5T4_02995 [Candidatus Micrarchaeia archaeon]
MAKYRFVCTCGKFAVESDDKQKVLEAAREHAKTCPDLKGADDSALEAMIEETQS